MNSPNREVSGGPTPIGHAPPNATTPLPGSFGLQADRATLSFDDGTVLLGGSPLRLLRLSARATALVARWSAGAPVGDMAAAQLLARRLVSGGAFLPQPPPSVRRDEDVTVVIPVRDRPEQLERLLGSLRDLSCVVVDDGSSDPSLTEEIAVRHGARVVCLPVNLGPSAARNAGLALATSPLIAFVDSDCVPSDDWLGPLLGHFDDPLVAAVAPRIVPLPTPRPTRLSRYEAVRSSLDRGPHEGLVRPQSRIPYVPSAALIVRRDVMVEHLFDPRLRGGEDVDLVWRLVDAGWDIRYVPASSVAHEGPDSPSSFLARRHFYGTTAAPLSERHPDNLAPLHVSAWSAAVWLFAVFRQPTLALGTLAVSILVLARRLKDTVADPVGVAGRIAGGGTARSALPALAGLTRAWSPAWVAGLLFRRTRTVAALALLAPALHDWCTTPGELAPAPYVALHVADDLAYGSGVWSGCLRARTVRPLIPRVAFRTSAWSSRSIRSSMPRRDDQTGDPP